MLFAQHDSDIARTAIAALSKARHSAITKQPKQIAQCNVLDPVLSCPASQTLALLAEAQPSLHWSDSGGARKPAAVQRRLAFVELIGPTGMFQNTQCRIGFFLQCGHCSYPLHRHAAEELYLVLSGKAIWHKDAMDPAWHSPGSFIHHTSWQTHAMTTVSEPLLALWCWTGEIAFEQYELVD